MKMKIRYAYIHLSLIVAFFLCSADSCNSGIEQQEKKQKELFNEKIETIKNGFKSNYLTDSELIAFELKARQKLFDFSDYFTLFSDKSLDTAFRNKAGMMMPDLFYNNNTTLDLKLDASEKRIRIDIESLLNKLKNSRYDILLLKIDSLWAFKTPERINESTYAGKIVYSQNIEGVMGSDTIAIDKYPMLCNFYVTRITSNLGTEPGRIWKVFLGNIIEY